MNAEQRLRNMVNNVAPELEHRMAHFNNGSEARTDYCPRECLSDGSYSVKDQVHDVLSTFSEEEYKVILEELEMATAQELYDAIEEDDTIVNDVIYVIEENSNIMWEDGEPYRYDECEYNEFSLFEYFLEINLYKNVSNDEDYVVKALIAVGGPHIELVSMDGSAVVNGYWGSYKCSDTSLVLDQFAELMIELNEENHE